MVTAAQKQIDTAREPKPLPVAALFRAYDEVLPQHDIDPDADQHLSAFVFRVGGEVGDGTLVEKFQAILERMGIVLEFGENSTVSVRNSSSPVPPDSPPTRPLTSAPESHGDQGVGKVPPLAPSFPDPTAQADAHEEQSDQDELSDDDDAEFGPVFGTAEVLQAAKRVTLTSAMKRWRNAAAQGRQNQGNGALATSLSRFGSGISTKASQSALEEDASQPPASAPIRNGYRENEPGNYRENEPGSSQPPSRDPGTEGPVYRPSLLSAVDRWRATVSQRHIQNGAQSPRRPAAQALETAADEHQPSADRGNEMEAFAGGQEQTLPAAALPISRPQVDATDETHQKSNVKSNVDETTSPRQEDSFPPPQTPEGQAAVQILDQRLLARAARAREIYLASRVFNHWADRTARRLEREAVARRHMIRFRCFRGWSQVPSSRTPTIDHLRVVTAAQKLQRAVAQNEEQLRLTAAAAAQAYHLRKIQQALDRWTCHFSEQAARQKVAGRARRKTLTRWLVSAGDDAVLREAVVDHRLRASEINALIRWQGQSERVVTRQTAALQIGGLHLSFAYLRDWWDQAESSRRAHSYRHYQLLEKARHAFDLWGLRARAQAFLWRAEYLSITRAFDLWAQKSQGYARAQNEAIQSYERVAKTRAWGSMRHLHQECSDLEHLENRSRLYLGATRLLDVFEASIARRKVREREEIKRYLMRRYQEVSRHRKKRNFFAALDRWRSLTAGGQRQASAAEACRAGRDPRRQLEVLESWSRLAVEGHQRHYQALLHHGKVWVGVWAQASLENEEQHLEAQVIWAAGKQWQYQKLWSISSLQQRGQAHTAAVLGRRYERDKCVRTFLRWKQQCNKGKRVAFEEPAETPRHFGSSSLLRSSWRPFSSRKTQIAREESSPLPRSALTDTPTRRPSLLVHTGSIFPATPMPSLMESDENTPSSADDDAAPPLSDRAHGGTILSGLPSTTPSGPVPAHLEREFRSRNSKSQLVAGDQSPSNRSRPLSRMTGPQPSLARSMPDLQATGRGIGNRSTPRTLSRPGQARSVTANASGLAKKAASDSSPTPAALGSQSVGPQAQRQYIISRQPVARRTQAEGASTPSVVPDASSEAVTTFRPSTGPPKLRPS